MTTIYCSLYLKSTILPANLTKTKRFGLFQVSEYFYLKMGRVKTLDIF